MPTNSDTLKLYMQSIKQYPLVTPEEGIRLAARIAKGDEDAHDRLICANLRLVVAIANDFKGFGLPMEDLIQEGNIGLIRAVEKFDPSKGAKLSSYAAWWIKQSMRRALANQARTIRIPVQSASKICRIQAAKAKLMEQLGREPTNKEIADEVRLTERTVYELLMGRMTTVPLEQIIHLDENGELIDCINDENDSRTNELVIEDNASSYEERLLYEELLSHMLVLTEKLDERERRILELRFGLNGEPPKTLEDVSQRIGRTRERVRQIEIQALGKLRRMLEEDGMIDKEEHDEYDDEEYDVFDVPMKSIQLSSGKGRELEECSTENNHLTADEQESHFTIIGEERMDNTTTIKDIARLIDGCLDDRSKVKAVFSDWLSSNRLQINLLMNAYDSDVVSKLRSCVGKNDSALTLQGLMQTLIDDYGISDSSAQWALITWCYLLGLDSLTIVLGALCPQASNAPVVAQTPNSSTLALPVQTPVANSYRLDAVYRAGYDIPDGTILIVLDDKNKHNYKLELKVAKDAREIEDNVVFEFDIQTYVTLTKGDYIKVDSNFNYGNNALKIQTFTVTKIS